MTYLPGVSCKTVDTDRLQIAYLDSGPEGGEPIVFLHGNLATGRFFEHVMAMTPDRYRCLAPDMRGFGDTERVPIDSTRGLKDWADDTYSFVQALGIDKPVHLVGWSTGGAAVAEYAIAHPTEVASLTLLDPVSPFGFGGTRDHDGTPTAPDFAGSGGGTGNQDFAALIAAGDRSSEGALAPRNVMNSSYWSAKHREPEDREEILLTEVLKSLTGEDGYPGDLTTSENWPGVAPGTRGILNALSGKYCNWSSIVDIEPKPPVLWTHGTEDIVVSDNSAWDLATLGKLGLVPGYPGEEVFPQQPMVGQIRAVLEQYRAKGGSVQMEMFDGSGHGPHFDAADRWQSIFFDFLALHTSKE